MAKARRLRAITDLRGKKPELYSGPGAICKSVCQEACNAIQANLQRAKEDRHSADYTQDQSSKAPPYNLGQ